MALLVYFVAGAFVVFGDLPRVSTSISIFSWLILSSCSEALPTLTTNGGSRLQKKRACLQMVSLLC